MRKQTILDIDGINIRVTKKGKADNFTVLCWIVGFSTSYISFRNKLFSNDEELEVEIRDYLEMLEETSEKFQALMSKKK